MALLAVCLAVQPVLANWCAVPGRDGSAAISGIVNTYFAGAASVSAGATSISLSYARGAPQDIQAGDLLLVIQMQDAEISTANNDSYGDGIPGGYGNGYTAIGNSGRYEFVRATSGMGAFGGNVSIQGETGGGLVNNYDVAPYSDTALRKSFQVVRVPQYAAATLSSTVSAVPWDGNSGGIVAIDVAGRLTFAGGAVNVAGMGFRGGAGRDLGGGSGAASDFATSFWAGANGQKGEGVAGAPWFVLMGNDAIENRAEGYPGGGSARGAPGNAGGGGTDGFPGLNIENSGGGGGGNGGEGGGGGHAWCSGIGEACNNDFDNPSESGGHPGARISESDAGRLVFGGGGGAGTSNNSSGNLSGGLASSGAAGGGIVLIRAGEIAGSGHIAADGADANNSVDNDGSGGGGAGGSVFIASVRTADGTALSISANGGDGGSNSGGGTAHGPGGGGGGGVVLSTFLVSASLSGGRAGTTVNTPSRFGPTYGAGDGNSGFARTIAGRDVPGLSSGGECTPTIVKSFSTPESSPDAPVRLRIEVANNNPTLPLTDVAFTDSYPADLLNTASPGQTNSCATGNLTASPLGNSLSVANGTIPAGASCTYSVNVSAATTGAKVNLIDAGDLTGSYGLPNVISNLEATSATVTIYPPLTLAKSGQAGMDPLNGTTNPTLIPGSLLTYSLTLTGYGSSVLPNSIAIVDKTPDRLAFFLGDLPGGSGPARLIEGASSSGLTLSYAGPSSMSDDISFSSDGGASWTYVPSPGADGSDPAITHVRFNPKGLMTPGSSVTITFGYIIQ